MARIAEGRTVIIIAHRLSAVRHCQRIIALEQGRISESGSHHELLANGGCYALVGAATGAAHGGRMMRGLLTPLRRAWQQLREAPALLKRSRDEYEFQPGYLEIVERPPAPWARVRHCC